MSNHRAATGTGGSEAVDREYIRYLTDRAARLRAEAERLPENSPSLLRKRVDLADTLLGLAWQLVIEREESDVTDTALPTDKKPYLWTADGTGDSGEADAYQAFDCVREVGEIIGTVLPTLTEDSAARRKVCALAADHFELKLTLNTDEPLDGPPEPAARDALTGFLSGAVGVVPFGEGTTVDRDDLRQWLSVREEAEAALTLARLLMNRLAEVSQQSEPTDAELARLASDRDLAIALLGPLLLDPCIDLPDDEKVALHALRGLMLGERAAADEPDPRPTDRRDAMNHLAAACEDLEEHPEDALPDAVLELGRQTFVVHAEKCSVDEPSGAFPRPGFARALALLEHMAVMDHGADGAEACMIGVSIAMHMYDHEKSPGHADLCVDWYRHVLRHPLMSRNEVRENRLLLALQLFERALMNSPDPERSMRRDPAAHQDFDDALDQLQAVLDDLLLPADADDFEDNPAEREEMRGTALDGVISALDFIDLDDIEDDRLDRVISRASDALNAVSLSDEDRGLYCLRLGNMLAGRGARHALPGLNTLIPAVVNRDPRDPTISIAANNIDAMQDLDEAIKLLRTGARLADRTDPMYVIGVKALAAILTLRFVCDMPEVNRPLVDEAVRTFRIALDYAPLDDDFWNGDDLDRFIAAASVQLFTRDLFAKPEPEVLFGSRAHDVANRPGVQEEIRLLRMLYDRALRQPEPDPVHVIQAFLLAQISRVEMSDQELAAWQSRVRDAAARLTGLEAEMRPLAHAMTAMCGFELAQRGAATDAEVARAYAELVAARRAISSNGLFAQGLDRALGPDFQAVDPTKMTSSLLTNMFGPIIPPAGRRSFPTRRTDDEPQDSKIVSAGRVSPVWIDLSAAVLVGDGAPDPLAHSPERVMTIVAELAGGTASSERDALMAVAHHTRWIQERDSTDLSRALALVQRAIDAVASHGTLWRRLVEYSASMLLDRYQLLGDRADLDTARRLYTELLSTHIKNPDKDQRDLIQVLVDEGASGALPQLDTLVRTNRPVRAETGIELQIAVAFIALLSGVADAEEVTTGTSSSSFAVPPPNTASDTTARLLGDLRSVLAALPDGHARGPAVQSELAWHAARSAAANTDRSALRSALANLRAAADRCPPESPHWSALVLRAAAARLEHYRALAGPSGPSAVVDAAVTDLDAALAAARFTFHGARARCQYGLGMLLLERYFLRTAGSAPADGPGRADLDRAVALLEAANAAHVASPGDPFTATVLRGLAQAYRAYGPGDVGHWRDARETARSALSAHARTVLLQGEARSALAAARRAAADMLGLVQWCTDDKDDHGALEAVELGRGLTLHAATVSSTVPAMLVEAGHPVLAQAWIRAATGPIGAEKAARIPDDLRLRVLEALHAGQAERRLLSAPKPEEIGAAVREVGADALVYLVPDTDAVRGGTAILVDGAGQVDTIALPQLTAGSASVVDSYFGAFNVFQRAVSSADPAEDIGSDMRRRAADHDETATRDVRVRAHAQWRGALDELCRWAGKAAMDEVLRHPFLALPSPARRDGRVPRLVLAPIGALGIVPWHAALLPAGRRPLGADAPEQLLRDAQDRRVLHAAVVSYCATGRQLIEVASRRLLPLDAGQLILIDPGATDDVSAMSEEARVLCSHFYPQATVFGPLDWYEPVDGPWTGPTPAGRSTLAAVSPYLPGHGAAAAGLIYANCHAVSGRNPADSMLHLDENLTAARLLAGSAAAPSGTPGGLVVMANCTTDLSLGAHDEALTLSTAFLAAGASAVMGSRWSPVDDARTSLMMFMLNYFLTGREGTAELRRPLPPADALRATQLWMLDPQREVPGGAARLAERVDDANLVDPEIWATFAHHGR